MNRRSVPVSRRGEAVEWVTGPMTRYRTALAVVAAVIGFAVLLTIVRQPAPASLQSPSNLFPVSDRTPAPEFTGLAGWINSAPLTVAGLRGHVVLVDFWTFSCVNCVRTLPHLKALYSRYHSDGLVIVGMHSPEFDFEKVAANVRDAVSRLAVTWPVALDSQMQTWNAYANNYWPAEYLIDKRGHVRHAHFGEGEYPHTEQLIRTLLGVRAGGMTNVRDATPTELMTPETYLGAARIQNYAGLPIQQNKPATYRFPRTLGQNQLAYAGRWTIGDQRAVPSAGARLRLHFFAKKVFLVLGGRGDVQVLVNGRPWRTVHVTSDRLYTLVDSPRELDALLELRFSAGVSAYAFTFG